MATTREHSTIDEKENERLEAAQEWLHENGTNISAIEHKLSCRDGAGLATPAMVIKRKTRRKDDGPLEIVCGWIVEHQIGLAVNLLVLLALTHICFPRARRHTRKFFELSYYNAETGQYCSGWNDAWMVSFWIVVFTGLRAAVMDYILTPMAKNGGIETERNQTRFAEQAWLLVYYSAFCPIGMYIYYTSDYWFELKELWTNWPNREMGGLHKWYILVQYAYWLQQFVVINIEKRRKDYLQMFTHHVVTTILIFTAYGYHQTKVANLILGAMDIVDLLLPLAKCVKYLGHDTIADYIFAVFMLVWIAARHVFYLIICYSVYSDSAEQIDAGCYRGKSGAITGPFPPPNRVSYLFEPFRDPQGIVCWTSQIKWGFLSALLFLQGITLIWFWMICRVAATVIRGGQADDVRSDDEGEVEDCIDEQIIGTIEQLDESELPPYEEEVGVESINLKGRTKYRKNNGSASGVSLPGHSDRKELLGRIGCDKGI